jgi:hypothetical protein
MAQMESYCKHLEERIAELDGLVKYANRVCHPDGSTHLYRLQQINTAREELSEYLAVLQDAPQDVASSEEVCLDCDKLRKERDRLRTALLHVRDTHFTGGSTTRDEINRALHPDTPEQGERETCRDGWIDAKQRLPDAGQEVIFVVDEPDTADHGRILGGRFTPLVSRAERTDFSTPGVGWRASHWMPAPKPPIEIAHEQGGEDE